MAGAREREAERAGGAVGSGTPAGQCLGSELVGTIEGSLGEQFVPVIVVRLACATCRWRDSVYALSHDSCCCGKQDESDLHLGEVVVTVNCRRSDVSKQVPRKW
jgi:hypothetical protein